MLHAIDNRVLVGWTCRKKEWQQTIGAFPVKILVQSFFASANKCSGVKCFIRSNSDLVWVFV